MTSAGFFCGTPLRNDKQIALRCLILAGVSALGFFWGFWLYSSGRTMTETVGLTLRGTAGGLLLVVLFAMFPITPLLLAGIWGSHARSWGALIFVAFSVAALNGSFFSECWILRDEVTFNVEIRKGLFANSYSRSRAWPNDGCSLVFIPGRGTHATD
jgi:hypothetical protein